MRHSRVIQRTGLALLLALPATLPVAAGAQSPPVIDAERADALVKGMLAELSRPEKEPVALSLAEAVRTAVANNPGIRDRAEVPAQSAQDVKSATGAYEPSLSVGAGVEDLNVPSASALSSGRATFQQEQEYANVTISKLLRTGATVDLAFNNQRTDSNSRFSVLNPNYQPELLLSFEQPLLRNIGGIDEETTVLVARSDSERAAADFEAELATFVDSVIEDYWQYVQAEAELEVRRRSSQLAQELVREAESKVDVGLLPPVAVKEARADAARRDEEVLVATNALDVAARELQHRVMHGAATGHAPDPVRPAEEHVVAPLELDRETSLRKAVEHRAEVRGAAIELERERLDEKRNRNLKLPDLKLVARYGLVGLAGTQKGITTLPDGTTVSSGFAGDYGDALDELATGDFTEAAIGIELEVPLANSQAEARYAKSEIAVRRAARRLEEEVSQVALDVARALADVESAFKRVGASRLARELAEENLHNQKRRYELGAVTTKDVLDFQERLAAAMAAEVRAVTDHAKAVARLRLAEGTLLDRFSIRVSSPELPGRPWWARF